VHQTTGRLQHHHQPDTSPLQSLHQFSKRLPTGRIQRERLLQIHFGTKKPVRLTRDQLPHTGHDTFSVDIRVGQSGTGEWGFQESAMHNITLFYLPARNFAVSIIPFGYRAHTCQPET
jgi:hypothetical protein